MDSNICRSWCTRKAFDQSARLTKWHCVSMIRCPHRWTLRVERVYFTCSSKEMLAILSAKPMAAEAMTVRASSWLSTPLVAFKSRVNRKWGSGCHTSRITHQSTSSDEAPPTKVPWPSKQAQEAGYKGLKCVSLKGIFYILHIKDNHDTFCYRMIDLTCFLHNNIHSIPTVLTADFCLPTESSTLNGNSQCGRSSSWNG